MTMCSCVSVVCCANTSHFALHTTVCLIWLLIVTLSYAYVSYLLVSFANTSMKYLKQYVHYLILALCMCPLLTFHVIVVAVWIHER